MRRAILLALLALGLLAPAAAADGLHITPAATGRFPERAFLLTLPKKISLSAKQVSVTENGAPVSGLAVRSAKAVGGKHFGTVLVIDTSRFMRGTTIQDAMAAARSFAQERSGEQPLGVVTFEAGATTVLPLTTDKAAIEGALAGQPAVGGGAHIYSAVSVALQMLARAHVIAGNVIVLSDGAQTGHISPKAAARDRKQVVSTATAQNVHVYTVGVYDHTFDARKLRELAGSTGGTYDAVSASGLTALFRRLGAELSDQYLVSYRSLAPAGSSVRVAVRVTGEPGAASASYSTPAIPAPASGTVKAHSSFWSSTGADALIAIVCALLIGLATLMLLRPRRSVRARVGRFVSTAPVEETKSWSATLLEHAFADDDGALALKPRWVRLSEELELARVGLSLTQIVVLTAIGTVLVGVLLISATASPVAALLGLAVPVGVRAAIRVKVTRQRRAFDEQLPDNLQVVASAMRAGHTFVGALAVVAEDAAEPSRRELRRVLTDEQLGVPLVDTLNNVTARMHSRDFQHVALVAALQRETGGNTAEVIDTVSDTVRERMDLRRLVRTLTAEGRLTAGIVASLPVALLMFISLVAPQYVHPLYHRAAGIIGLVVGAAMICTAFVIMRRIVDIET
jgi:tight adherence protein B